MKTEYNINNDRIKYYNWKILNYNSLRTEYVL